MTLAAEISKPEYAGMTDRQIADAINAATVPVICERLIGYGTVMEALGADAGAALLDALEALSASTPAVKWAMRLLDKGDLNVGSTAVRAQLDALCAGGVMTALQRDSLKALGEAPGPYRATLGFTREVDPQDIISARGEV